MMSSDIGLMTECVLVHRKVNTALYKYISTILNDIEITESDIGHHSFSLLSQLCQEIDHDKIVADLEGKSKLVLYADICGGAVQSAPYLEAIRIPSHRIAVTKLRTSNHSLMIEKGRWRGVPKEQRLCKVCECNEIEDEIHFLMECSAYRGLRQKLFDCANCYFPGFLDLTKRAQYSILMSNALDQHLYTELGYFVYNAFKTRAEREETN